MNPLAKRILILVLGLGAISPALFAAGSDIKLRFLEGSREGTANAPAAVTSSYGDVHFLATIPAEYSLDKEIAQLKKVFAIKDVKLVTEADLKWPARGDKLFHIIQFEGKEYLVLVTPGGGTTASKFRLEVYEQEPKSAAQASLLDTEFELPNYETVVFGFEDTHKTAYFLYMTWPANATFDGVQGGVLGGVQGGVEGGIPGGISGGVEGGVEGGVQSGVFGGVEGTLGEKPGAPVPKLVKRVEPAYPEIARMAQVEGAVILKASVDGEGAVRAVQVLRSIPLLDQAAVDAVKQWVYEPLLVNGKLQPFETTVTVKFTLDEKGGKAAAGGQAAVRAVPPINPPKLLKEVAPVYPEIAKQAKVEGVVICEATTDTKGKVIDVKILRSIPLLDQAAIDAVKRWVYEPLVIDGKPTAVIFTVTVRFTLDKDKAKGQVASISIEDKEFAEGAVKVEGELKPPKLVKEVAPLYPLKAKQGRVEGVVILAARTDVTGKVKKVKVLRSIPALDQAAIDAVKQWEYEPLIVNGKAVEAVFTVTVRFEMKKNGDESPTKR